MIDELVDANTDEEPGPKRKKLPGCQYATPVDFKQLMSDKQSKLIAKAEAAEEESESVSVSPEKDTGVSSNVNPKAGADNSVQYQRMDSQKLTVISASSAGFHGDNLAQITIDGIKIGVEQNENNNYRGLHTVIIDPKKGILVDAKAFDTYKSSDAFEKFL